MRGQEVIASANPKGHFEECIISGTPKPGTCMEIVPAVAAISGRFTYRLVTRASGAIGPICVLLRDELQGKLITDAYVNGTRGFLYWPVAGEELNMVIDDVVGTGCVEDTAIGDLLMVETVTGELMANSAGASAPFAALEKRSGFITADTLEWVKYLGNQA